MIQLQRVSNLDVSSIRPLVAESLEEGVTFIERLEREYLSGVNRFDGPGEVLFVATEGDTPVAVCGLNRDPYLGDPAIGRVRHLYVLKAYRHLGLGRSLVRAVMAAAEGRFHMLTLRTENPVAARLYVSLGSWRSRRWPTPPTGAASRRQRPPMRSGDRF